MLYFKARWNPACTITDEHIYQFSNKYQVEIAKVDSDVAPRIAQHYGVRS